MKHSIETITAIPSGGRRGKHPTFIYGWLCPGCRTHKDVSAIRNAAVLDFDEHSIACKALHRLLKRDAVTGINARYREAAMRRCRDPLPPKI